MSLKIRRNHTQASGAPG